MSILNMPTKEILFYCAAAVILVICFIPSAAVRVILTLGALAIIHYLFIYKPQDPDQGLTPVKPEPDPSVDAQADHPGHNPRRPIPRKKKTPQE